MTAQIASTTLPDLSIGLGSAIYALAKCDGRVQLDEMQTVKEILAHEPHGDLALYTFMLREEYGETVDDAYDFALRRFQANRKALDEPTKKRFVDIMTRIAGAHDDVSRKEQEMIQRFRRDIRRL